jgi:hypothetical protein
VVALVVSVALAWLAVLVAAEPVVAQTKQVAQARLTPEVAVVALAIKLRRLRPAETEAKG